MSYGFQSINGSNTVQIDDEMRHQGLLQEGYAYTGSPVYFNSVSHPTVQVLSPSGYVSLQELSSSHFLLAGSDGWDPLTIGFSYRVYADMSEVHAYNALLGYGLAIFDSTGVLKYSSNYKVLRVHATALVSLDAYENAVNYISGQWVTVNGTGIIGLKESADPNISDLMASYVISAGANTIQTGVTRFAGGPSVVSGGTTYSNGNYTLFTGV
jgi:hypothetical protein